MPTDKEIEAAAKAMVVLHEDYEVYREDAKLCLEAAEKVRGDEEIVGYLTSYEDGELKRRYVTRDEFYLRPTKED